MSTFAYPIECPNCRTRLKTKNSPVDGARFRCPTCNQSFSYGQARSPAPANTSGPATSPLDALNLSDSETDGTSDHDGFFILTPPNNDHPTPASLPSEPWYYSWLWNWGALNYWAAASAVAVFLLMIILILLFLLIGSMGYRSQAGESILRSIRTEVSPFVTFFLTAAFADFTTAAIILIGVDADRNVRVTRLITERGAKQTGLIPN